MLYLMSNWRTKRQLSYLSVVLIIILILALGSYWYWHPQPTCFDGQKNGTETGVDCGGSCQKACLNKTLSLKVIWTRVLESGDGRYDVASMIENFNADVGLKEITYLLRIYDSQGALITSKTGLTYVNPREKFVIFEPGLVTDKRLARSATLEIMSQSDWLKTPALSATVVLERVIEPVNFTTDAVPRLHYRLINNSLEPLSDLAVAIILNDDKQNAYAGSKTLVESLAKGEIRDLYFTWPTPLSHNPASIDTYWRFNGFSHNP